MRYLPVIFHTLAGMLTLLVSASALAQDDVETSRWYRVELLVFSQPPDASSRREVFDPEPSLNYPGKVRFLLDPQRIAANQELHPGVSTLDALGRQLIDQTDVPERQTDIPEPAVAEPIPTDAAVTPAADPSSPDSDQLLTPQPFVLRDDAELEFRGKAAYMERRGGYRTLFHETWLQPMADRPQSPSIVLDHSGDDQAYPSLQGTIRLFVSRYLHLQTNLWLNTDGSYLSRAWQMPAPPLGPASLIITGNESADAQAEAESEAEARINYFPAADAAASDQPLDPNAAALPPEAPDYPFRHAVKLQQQTRMRGNEVHYLDHPMLGVVIKLTPLSETDLDMIARSDADSQAQAE